MAFPIFIQTDTASFDGPLDLRRSDTPSFWSGTDIVFRIAVYEFGVLKDVSKFKSLTLEIKAMKADGTRPDPGASALMSKTVTGFNNDLTATEWTSYTDSHASVPFSASETAIPAGSHWLVISAIVRNGDYEENLTLAAGGILVEQDGHGTVGVISIPDDTAYTKAVTDARYARIVAGSAVFVDATGGSDATARRGRADLPFATLTAAVAAASAGDLVSVAPGAYASTTVDKALGFSFSSGATLAAPLVVNAEGVRLSGRILVDPSASYIATSTGTHTVAIDGALVVGKPFGVNLTATGGMLVDASSSSVSCPGLTSRGLVATVDWNDVTNHPSVFPASAHAASHATGGADAVTPASIGAATAEALATESSRALTAEGLKAPLATPVVAETTAARTLALSDANNIVRCTYASAVTVTVPASASVAFAVGTTILVRQVGAGQVTLAAASGVTLNTSTTLKTRRQHATIALTKIGADEWDVAGERALS
jgi:hypothetical protein